jgi:hypothetical protein
MTIVNCNSVIFVTGNGPYRDKWLAELQRFPCGQFAGYRMLEWLGQNWGGRDHLVKPGTYVAVRKKGGDNFKLIGVVGLITKVKDSLVPGEAATYHIMVHEYVDQPVMRRGAGDSAAHWVVLRHLGIPHVAAGVAQGIYG